MGPPTFFVLFLILFFFLKLIVACRLCVIYVREIMIPMYIACDYMAYMDYMDLAVCCPQKGH